MTRNDDADGPEPSAGKIRMTEEQLRAYEQGWAARIMPVKAGWKIDYFSIPDFEREPGTVFPTFEDALIALAEVLPAANAEEQRLKAREDLRRLRTESDRSDEAGWES